MRAQPAAQKIRSPLRLTVLQKRLRGKLRFLCTGHGRRGALSKRAALRQMGSTTTQPPPPSSSSAFSTRARKKSNLLVWTTRRQRLHTTTSRSSIFALELSLPQNTSLIPTNFSNAQLILVTSVRALSSPASQHFEHQKKSSAHNYRT